MNVFEFLVRELLADEELKAIVDDRIWPLVVPETLDSSDFDSAPFILYQLSSSPSNVLTFPYIQVKLFSKKYSDLVVFESAVRRVFTPKSKWSESGLEIEAVTFNSLGDSSDNSLGETFKVRTVEVRFVLRS